MLKLDLTHSNVLKLDIIHSNVLKLDIIHSNVLKLDIIHSNVLKLDIIHSNVLNSDLTRLCEGNEGLLPSSSSSLLPGQWSTGNNVRLNVNVCVNGIF